MSKVVIYDDNGDVVFSRSFDSKLREVNIKTTDKEIKFSIDEKKINAKPTNQDVLDMINDDDFWK